MAPVEAVREFRDPTTRWLLPPVAAALWLAACAGAGRALGLAPVVPPGWGWAGLVPMGIAALLVFASVGLFNRRGTTVLPHGEPTALVTGGPFRFTRNPMYLSLALLLLGLALADGRASSFLAPAGFLLTAHLVYVPREERALRAAFGAAYDDYSRRVRRWL
jgi:protein-S-isoprenylcysteine O-methyltransferase Ste14